jgi:hypothetical protein
VTITVRKAQAKGRQHTTAGRDVDAESSAGAAWLYECLTREPSPDEAATLVDLMETLLRGLPALHGQVLEMSLAGHTAAEITASLNVSRRTVYRVLELFQQRLLQEESAGETDTEKKA